MASLAAFLRGINLGKSRRVKNEALRDAFEGLGFDDVATFRASGNVVFGARASRDLGERIESALEEALGIEVVVFLRAARQMREIAGREPFSAAELATSAGRAQVALLPRRPSAAARRRALAMAGEEDRLAIEGSELHWLPRDRMSGSELDLKALESQLGPWTMRTMGTIEQIAERHFSRPSS
jgi:uncharacterized protein (DUF1697 family)